MLVLSYFGSVGTGLRPTFYIRPCLSKICSKPIFMSLHITRVLVHVKGHTSTINGVKSPHDIDIDPEKL